MKQLTRTVVSVFAVTVLAGVGLTAAPGDAGQIRADWACC